MSTLNFKIDHDADALYVYLSNQKFLPIKKTICLEDFIQMINLDFGSDDKIYGIEIIPFSDVVFSVPEIMFSGDRIIVFFDKNIKDSAVIVREGDISFFLNQQRKILGFSYKY